MRVLYYSDYLLRREAVLAEQARQTIAQPFVKPSGWLRRLVWVFSKDASQQRQKRELTWRRLTAEVRAYAKGRRGEDALMHALDHHLDDRYLLIRNYELPVPFAVGGDVDAVLVGPHGITVFEVKTWTGRYRYSGDQWLYRHATRGWEPAWENPSGQARRNVERITLLLAREGLSDIPLQAVVVLASEATRIELVPPLSTYVFFPYRKRRALAWLPAAQLGQGLTRELESVLLDSRWLAQGKSSFNLRREKS